MYFRIIRTKKGNRPQQRAIPLFLHIVIPGSKRAEQTLLVVLDRLRFGKRVQHIDRVGYGKHHEQRNNDIHNRRSDNHMLYERQRGQHRIIKRVIIRSSTVDAGNEHDAINDRSNIDCKTDLSSLGESGMHSSAAPWQKKYT